MIWAGLLAAVAVMYILARVFRAAAGAADRPPAFTWEKPPLPRDLAAVAARIEQWREEGRLTREEHEKLSALVREEAPPH